MDLTGQITNFRMMTGKILVINIKKLDEEIIDGILI